MTAETPNLVFIFFHHYYLMLLKSFYEDQANSLYAETREIIRKHEQNFLSVHLNAFCSKYDEMNMHFWLGLKHITNRIDYG